MATTGRRVSPSGKGRPTPRRGAPPRRRRRNPAALIVVLVLALGGAVAGVMLATGSKTKSGVTLPGGDFIARPRLSPAGNEPVSSGEPAPDFSVRTIDGRTVSLADVRGKPTVLFFMAYWGGSCIPEGQALDRIYEQFKDRGLQVIAVDVDPTSSPDALREWIDAAGSPGYTFSLDIRGQTALAYKVRSLDVTVVIDRDGRVVYRDSYITPYDALLKAISPVVA